MSYLLCMIAYIPPFIIRRILRVTSKLHLQGVELTQLRVNRIKITLIQSLLFINLAFWRSNLKYVYCSFAQIFCNGQYFILLHLTRATLVILDFCLRSNSKNIIITFFVGTRMYVTFWRICVPRCHKSKLYLFRFN